MERVTLFHTSDIHNKLTPEQANRLRDLKESHPGSIMLDSGDAIWSGNIYWRPGGEPILDLMNSVPYDAMCMGNREFHFLSAGIENKTSRANFPILSANLRSVKNGSLETGSNSLSLEGEGWGEGESCQGQMKPFITFHHANIRVTVLGLSVPCITEKMFVKKLSAYYFEQPQKVAAEIVPQLREQCDVLIALTHIGLKQDIELAKSVEGIDLILGGHTHTITEQPERVGDTFILHSGFYAHHVRKIEVELKAGKVGVKSELMPLGKA